MSKNLNCADLIELITDYLDDELSIGERWRFNKHLRGCTGCTNYLAQMRTTIELTGRLSVNDMEPEVLAELLNTFRTFPRDK